MTTKEICKVHYLSCVEAYFGAWLKEFIELPMLYSESYMPWKAIVRAFENPAVNYANFPYIPRIQDLAERLGIVSHRKESGMPQSYNKNDLVLISVNESFFQKQKPWRRDHYIAIEELTEKKLKYLNEYPLELGELSIEDFKSKFGGESLIFSLQATDVHSIAKSSLLQPKIPDDLPSICGMVLPIQRLRDAIGILRVSRRRAVEWLDWCACNNSIANLSDIQAKLLAQIKFTDNCYFRLQSMILRNEHAEESFFTEMVDRIANFEIDI